MALWRIEMLLPLIVIIAAIIIIIVLIMDKKGDPGDIDRYYRLHDNNESAKKDAPPLDNKQPIRHIDQSRHSLK